MTANLPTTINSWLIKASGALMAQGISSAVLDSEILVSHVLNKPRTWVHAHSQERLSQNQHRQLNRFLQRRAAGQPIAYITGQKEFYGRNFIVSPEVLIPRPESENFIEIVKTLPSNLKFIDIGTGSGILAITSVLVQPTWSGVATDISQAALKVAQKNTRKLGAKNLVFKVQNLLVDDTKKYDVVLANLPYVPQNLFNKADISFEPKIALFAGEDGLDIYRELFKQIMARKHKPTHILTESLLNQHKQIEQLAKSAGYRLGESRGLIQHFVQGREEP